jgi:hypothetical protein
MQGDEKRGKTLGRTEATPAGVFHRPSERHQDVETLHFLADKARKSSEVLVKMGDEKRLRFLAALVELTAYARFSSPCYSR